MAKRGFGGFPGGGNMNALLQQAQRMQREMAQAQEEIAQSVVEASAGGGMVQVKMNGQHEVTELTIKPEAVDPEDVELLQDLILAALNQARQELDALSDQKLGKFKQLGMGF